MKIKRIFDIVCASILSIILIPFFILIALLIKLNSKGTVLYRQERIGKDKRPFVIYKFRTMIEGAEDKIDDIIYLNETNGNIFKIKNDPRTTLVGKFLRRYSLDEFPQFINVIKGDMSFVGPRPPLSREVEQYNEWESQRLKVLPGITGLWQISGRSDLTFGEMVKLDLYYIRNQSLLLDLYIMLKTIPAVFKKRGAY